MDEEAANAAEAYKGTASIIQGALIALSALIACAGYYIKARQDRNNHVREHDLAETRMLLKDLVGPAQALSYCAMIAIMEYQTSVVYPEIEFGDLISITRTIYNGTPANHSVTTFVGAAKEAEMRENPAGKLAVSYRRFMRRLLREFLRPLADIVRRNMNVFPVPTMAVFREQYSNWANEFCLRKTFFLKACTFIAELEDIVEIQWAKEGDYSNLFPCTPFLGTQLTGYLAAQVSDLKTKIEKLTMAKQDSDNQATNPQTKREQDRINQASAKARKATERKSRTTAAVVAQPPLPSKYAADGGDQ